MSAPSSLVVGGTGVSGSFIVRGLLERGHTVTVLTTGRTIPTADIAPWWHGGTVRRLVGDVDDPVGLAKALERADGPSWSFTNVFVLYGRLRATAPVFVGRVSRFFSGGGMFTYDTYGTAAASSTHAVRGQVVNPLDEDTTPLMSDDGSLNGEPVSFNPKLNKIIQSEKAVYTHHPRATHIRYGYLYGPNNILPVDFVPHRGAWQKFQQAAAQMWCVVKRLLDGRRRIVISPQAHWVRSDECYGQNAAQYFLLSLDRPQQSIGQIFNGLESQMLTTVQWIWVVAQALGCEEDLELVEMPSEIATPYRPISQGRDDGRAGPLIFTNAKARRLLGYADVVPKREAVARTARWMAANQDRVHASAKTLQDPYDYGAEDQLLAAWDRRDYSACLAVRWVPSPGWGHFYYGSVRNPGDPFHGDLAKKYSGSYNRDLSTRQARL